MFTLYDRIQIEGIMPERGLLRLKRAGIPLYDIKKAQQNRLTLRVQRKDLAKIFSIYPQSFDGEKSIYTVSKIGAAGIAKIVDFFQNRAGFVLGCLAFCMLTLTADFFVFGVEFVGTSVYARETMQVLEENGIKLFTLYKKGREDTITAKLLSLDFVEFCSVQKVGGRIRVETRLSSFAPVVTAEGKMQAKHTGEIVSITVLRGTALKKAGDTVLQGETLVEDWFLTEDGRQVCVKPIARVKLACVYEEVHTDADSEEQAFAQGYLALDLEALDQITEATVTKIKNGFQVTIRYEITERVNL